MIVFSIYFDSRINKAYGQNKYKCERKKGVRMNLTCLCK